MSSQNWVYPFLRQDRPSDFGSPKKATMLQGTIEPGSPILSPVSGEIVTINYHDWDEVSAPLEEQNMGSLFSLGILMVVNGVRVINVIGPILYRWGAEAKPQPKLGEAVYRGEELGEAPDLNGGINLTWTVYMNDRGNKWYENPVKVAKSFGALQYYDDENLAPENPEPQRRPEVSEKGKFSPVALFAILLGGALWLRKKS